MKAAVVNRDAPKMIKDEIVKDLENMLKWKRQAVEKIASEAEDLAYHHQENITHIEYTPFIHAKLIEDAKNWNPNQQLADKATKLDLETRPNFGDVPVNMKESAIHVPVNVWEEGPYVLNHVKWSEGLTQTFVNNHAFDPSINWQYFASNHGFLRLYPAAKWRYTNYTAKFSDTGAVHHTELDKAIDLYDARLRHWYISAAASPKDMIILLDGSGSMMGQRKEIARNVVLKILDTLTDDDYVSVIRFANGLEPVAPCFGFDLVQASKVNVREFKEQTEGMNTSGIANFSIALSHAFETLNEAYDSKQGSVCNQAIMIVSDGAPGTFEDIFEKYNWPRIGVRVFTYLVGREVTETREINWIACHNRGYYTHVANFAEVREQVQLYIPVMSRPLVLTGPSRRPYAWSPVYADVTEVPLSKWLWEERQKEKIRKAIQVKIQEKAAANGVLPPAGSGSSGQDESKTSDQDAYPDLVDPEAENPDLDYGEGNDTRAKRAAAAAASSSQTLIVSSDDSEEASFDQRTAQPYNSPDDPDDARKGYTQKVKGRSGSGCCKLPEASVRE